MKTTLGFMTEEGRTRLKNAIRKSCVYARAISVQELGVMRFIGIGCLAISRRSSAAISINYLKTSYRSYLPNSMSRYMTFSRVVTDAKTKKDISLAVHDDQIMPVLDEAGQIQLDKNHHPVILLREGGRDRTQAVSLGTDQYCRQASLR